MFRKVCSRLLGSISLFLQRREETQPFSSSECFWNVTPGSVVAMLDPEGASLGEQTNLLRMAEQIGGKNLGA